MMERTCFYCNQSMPAGTHPRRKYCNDQCKWKEAGRGATPSNRETIDCRHCEETFTRHIKDTWHVYCSNICQALHDPAREDGEQCNFPGCTKKRQAGKLCTSHYSVAWKKFTKKFTRTCSQCGDEFGSAKAQTTEVTFCSEPCQLTYMTAECGEKRAESLRRTIEARPKKSKQPKVKECAWCDQEFETQIVTAKYCGRNCRDNAARETRARMLSPMRAALENGDHAAVIEALKKGSVINEQGCWEWKTIKGDYPVVIVGRKHMAGHRIALEAKHGKPLGTQAAHHICANSKCVNPEHLQPVTHRENIAEMLARNSYLDRIKELEEAIREIDPDHEVLDRIGLS